MRALTALAAASLLVSTATSAVVVSFGGQMGSISSVNPSYVDPVKSIISSFTNQNGSPLMGESFYSPNGCTTLNANITTNYRGTGSYEVDSDSLVGFRYKPTHSGTCYGNVNASDNVSVDRTPGSISINLNGDTTALLYAGFYWGSADSFNYVKFIDTSGKEISGLAITYNNAAFGSGSTISGTDVNNALGPSIDREQFINFQFDTKENVGAIEIGNTGGCCFEFANYTDSSTQVIPHAAAVPALSAFAVAVSEPGAALALVAGLGMIGFARRRRA